MSTTINKKMTALGLLPEDWEVLTIEQIATISTGSQNTQDNVPNGKYPFYVRSQQIERINKWIFDTEGVVTAGDGVGTGKVFHYVNGKFGLHQRCYLIHNFVPKVNARYFYWVFKNLFYERVHGMTAKSSVDSVRREMIADMFIPLPPIEEQKQIADALSSLDTLITGLDEAIEKKSQIKEGLMHNLLTGKVHVYGAVGPWKEVKLKSISTISIGEFVHQKKMNPNGLYPVYNGGKTYTGFYDEYNNEPNKIVMSARGLAGYINKVERPYWAGNSSYSIKIVAKDVDWIYVYYYMKSHEKDFTDNRQQGGGIPAVNKNQVEDFVVKMPDSLEEQRTISTILSSVDNEIKAYEDKKNKYVLIKQGMMQKLLTGKTRLI